MAADMGADETEPEQVPHISYDDLFNDTLDSGYLHERAAINFSGGQHRSDAIQKRNLKLFEERAGVEVKPDSEWDFGNEDDHTAKVARRSAELVALDKEAWLVEVEAHSEAQDEAWGRVADADEAEAVDEPGSYAAEAVTEDTLVEDDEAA